RLGLRETTVIWDWRVHLSLLRSQTRVERLRPQIVSLSRLLLERRANLFRTAWGPACRALPPFLRVPERWVEQQFFLSLIPPEIWSPKPGYLRRMRSHDKPFSSTRSAVIALV